MKHALLLSFALAGAVSAQTTYTFPSDHATIPDGSSYSYFFPYSHGVSRMQAVYERWDMTVPVNTPITRIGFRKDGSLNSTGHSLQLTVLMGYTDKTAANLTTNYANNVSGTLTTVFGPALYTLPNLTAASSSIWLDLTTPFTYNPPAGQNLLIEWRIAANNNGNASFNYYLDRATFDSPVVAGQPGCPHSGSNTATLESRPSAVDGQWLMYLRTAPASSLVILMQNPGGQMQTPGVPLSTFVPGAGASCILQVSANGLFVTTALSNSSGNYNWNIRVPNNRSLNDVFVTNQALILDFFAPGGVVTSNADQMQLGIDPAMTILYSQGSTTAATGSLWQNYGVVTLFQ